MDIRRIVRESVENMLAEKHMKSTIRRSVHNILKEEAGLGEAVQVNQTNRRRDREKLFFDYEITVEGQPFGEATFTADRLTGERRISIQPDNYDMTDMHDAQDVIRQMLPDAKIYDTDIVSERLTPGNAEAVIRAFVEVLCDMREPWEEDEEVY